MCFKSTTRNLLRHSGQAKRDPESRARPGEPGIGFGAETANQKDTGFRRPPE